MRLKQSVVGSLCVAAALAAGCGGAQSTCPGNSPDPCQRLMNAYDCLASNLTNCNAATHGSVSSCDNELGACSSADQVQLDSLATCISQLPAGDCSQNPNLIQTEGVAEEKCYASLSVSTACRSALGLNVVASATEADNGACPMAPQTLTGTESPGASCTEAAQCAPTCCTCSNGSPQQFAAAVCENEACAALDSICSLANANLPAGAGNPCP